MCAASNGHIGIVELLISKGANISSKTNDNVTALMIAISNDYKQIIELLKKYIASQIEDTKTDKKSTKTLTKDERAFINASNDENIEAVKYLINKGVNINVKDNWGFTALINASKNADMQIIKYLISKGANINATDIDGQTALMWASKKGHIETTKYLIDNGADINVKNSYGETAFKLALKYKHSKIVELLKQNGAKE